MKTLLLFLFVTSLYSSELFLDSSVFENGNRAFVPHHGEGRFGSYLIQDVNYQPVANLRESLGKNLKHRGEAHITVVTPIEYFDVLKSKVSIKEIDTIALKEGIQESEFKVECLGRGKKDKDETYFIVVSAPKLIEIRQKIQELFESRGGAKNSFKANHFYPHITVGFSSRDLHESDGVYKDKHSCINQISIRN